MIATPLVETNCIEANYIGTDCIETNDIKANDIEKNDIAPTQIESKVTASEVFVSARFFLTRLAMALSAASLLATSAFADTSAPQSSLVNSTLTQAKALSAQGKYKDAFTLLKSAQKDHSTYAAMILNLANINMDEAEETADEAIQAFPNNAELHYLRGVIMGNQAQSSIFSALSYAEKSLNSFAKATQLAPDKIKYRKALMSFYLAAPTIAGGDEKLALEQLTAIQQADPLEGASSQVAFYQMTDEPKKAITVLEKAITDYPNEISFIFRLAVLHAQQEDYELAMPLFQTAAGMASPEFSIDPETGNPHDIYQRNQSAKMNALYQVGRTAVVTKQNTSLGLAAMGKLQAEAENTQLTADNLPDMEWAKARIAELHIQSGDKTTAASILATILVEGNKDLKKQVKKLKRLL